MLYTVDANKTKSIVVLVKGELSDTPDYVDFMTILDTPELINILAQTGYKLNLAYNDEIGVPFFLRADSLSTVKDCTAILNFLQSQLIKMQQDTFTKEQFDLICTKLAEKFQMELTEIRKIVESIIKWHLYSKTREFNGELNVGVSDYAPEYFNETKAYIEELNSAASNIFKSMSAKDNVTKVQKECTDELFIALPDPVLVFDDDTIITQLVPAPETVAVPYPPNFPQMYTPAYKDPGTTVPASLIPLIEGKESNNTLGIQDNEKRYYSAIKDWLDYTFSVAYPGVTVSAQNMVLNSRVQEYITELMGMLYFTNWRHNAHMPVSLGNSNSDIDSSEDTEQTSRYEFKYQEGAEDTSIHYNALSLLFNFLERVSHQLGPQIYAEAIIKLARWGERKCTALVFEGFPNAFYLGTSEEKAYIGSSDDYVFSRDKNGNIMKLEYAFKCPAILKDVGYFRRLEYGYRTLAAPVGVCCYMILTKKDDPTKTIKVNTYLSMVDLVKQIVSGVKIVGIRIDTNCVIHAESDLEISTEINSGTVVDYITRSTESFVVSPLYVSEELQDTYAELGVQGSHHCQFSILRDKIELPQLDTYFATNNFNTAEQLNTGFNTCKFASKAAAINANILSILLPIYTKASKRYVESEDKSFEALLNIYKDVLFEVNYSGENSFLINRKREPKYFRTLLNNVTGQTDSEPKPTAQTQQSTQSVSTKTLNAFDNQEASGETANAKSESIKPIEEEQSNKTTESSEPVEKHTIAQVQTTQSSPVNADIASTENPYSLIRPCTSDGNFALMLSHTGETLGIFKIEQVDRIRKGVIKKVNVLTLVEADYLSTHPNVKVVGSVEAQKVLLNLLAAIQKIEIRDKNNYDLFFSSMPVMLYYLKLFQGLIANRTI